MGRVWHANENTQKLKIIALLTICFHYFVLFIWGSKTKNNTFIFITVEKDMIYFTVKDCNSVYVLDNATISFQRRTQCDLYSVIRKPHK